MADRKEGQSVVKAGCLIALAIFSVYLAFAMYPAGAWKLGAAYATLALVSIVLRLGWVVPFTLAGTHAGMILDARVKGGTIESQMQETVISIVAGTICGFAIGALIDFSTASHPQAGHAEEHSGEQE